MDIGWVFIDGGYYRRGFSLLSWCQGWQQSAAPSPLTVHTPSHFGSLVNDPSAYNYLALSNCYMVDTIDDARDFAEVEQAMNTLGWSADDKNAVWRVLAGTSAAHARACACVRARIDVFA